MYALKSFYLSLCLGHLSTWSSTLADLFFFFHFQTAVVIGPLCVHTMSRPDCYAIPFGGYHYRDRTMRPPCCEIGLASPKDNTKQSRNQPPRKD